MYDVDGDGQLGDLERMMMKYDTDGNGTFSASEVREIVRDMEQAKKEARNMGRLALAVAVVGILLAGALLGLMFAANEASKENHVKGAVSVDLNNNPVETKPLQAFGSLLSFPELEVDALNELDYVSFSVEDGTDTIDMRFRVSAWTRSQTSKLMTLMTQDGSTITIQGDGSAASLLMGGQTYTIVVPARRLLEGDGSRPKLFGSMAEMKEHMGSHGGDRRRLQFGGAFGGALLTSGSFTMMAASGGF